MDHSMQGSCAYPMEFFSQVYWSGVPVPTPEDLPNPGIEPMSPAPPGKPKCELRDKVELSRRSNSEILKVSH